MTAVGRFIEHRYKPANDSSPGYDEPEATVVTLVVSTKSDESTSCACGCGEYPANPKSTFKMGHDARLKGKLIRAHLTGTPVVMVVGSHEYQPKPALAVADEHGWTDQLLAAERRRAASNRKVLSTAMHSKRLIKVGRWHYEGQVVAVYRNAKDEGLVDVQYVTRLGEVRTVKGLPAEEAPDAQD